MCNNISDIPQSQNTAVQGILRNAMLFLSDNDNITTIPSSDQRFKMTENRFRPLQKKNHSGLGRQGS